MKNSYEKPIVEIVEFKLYDEIMGDSGAIGGFSGMDEGVEELPDGL